MIKTPESDYRKAPLLCRWNELYAISRVCQEGSALCDPMSQKVLRQGKRPPPPGQVGCCDCGWCHPTHDERKSDILSPPQHKTRSLPLKLMLDSPKSPPYTPDMPKYCPRCDTDKALTEFRRNSARADGHSGWCKPCMADANRDWKERNPEVVRLHARIYYQNKKLRDVDG